MSAPIEKLLSRLDGVQERGPDRWLTRCPSHNDGRPSLSIQETGDGTVLIHCFAACSPIDVLAAIGLTLSDLFPTKYEHKGRRRPQFTARDVLSVLSYETLFVFVLASDIRAGKSINDDDMQRLGMAMQRIDRIREVARV